MIINNCLQISERKDQSKSCKVAKIESNAKKKGEKYYGES